MVSPPRKRGGREISSFQSPPGMTFGRRAATESCFPILHRPITVQQWGKFTKDSLLSRTTPSYLLISSPALVDLASSTLRASIYSKKWTSHRLRSCLAHACLRLQSQTLQLNSRRMHWLMSGWPASINPKWTGNRRSSVRNNLAEHAIF